MKWLPVWIVLLLTFFALTFSGCGGGSTNPVEPIQSDGSREMGYLPEEYCGEATVIPLIAGQDFENPAGEIIVTNDGDFLYIEFVAYAPWVLVETHVAVSDTLDGIPQTKKGNPKIGNFDYDINSWIDLSQWPDATELFIAAHAVVQMLGENGEVIQEETGWGEGEEFNDSKSWAMYFMYTIQDCCIELGLPEDCVDMSVAIGSTHYLVTTLTGVPPGFDIGDGRYNGWCADKYHLIYVGRHYCAYLYSSYRPDTWPDEPRVTDPEWDKINYIVNNRDGYTKNEVESAIWWYTDGLDYGGNANVQALIDAAERYGVGFKPGQDEVMIIIVFVPGDVQTTLIEVPTIC